MKNVTKKILFFLAFFTLAGCNGAELFISPIVYGVVLWKQGEVNKYYEYNSEVIYNASKRALQEMELTITKDNNIQENLISDNRRTKILKRDTDQKIQSRDYYIVAGNNNRFQISVDTVEKNVTRLQVRINIMGDKPYAELFYRKVDEQINIIEFKDGTPTKQKSLN